MIIYSNKENINIKINKINLRIRTKIKAKRR